MNRVLQDILAGPRKLLITGPFGCGKSEIAVSLAFGLRQLTQAPLALGDLDIENPYFRSRERTAELEQAGIRVYSDPFHGKNGSELQVIDPAVRAPLEDPSCRVILDCGGGASGAMILNQFREYFREDTELVFVTNAYRPYCDSPGRALQELRAIEETTRLQVTGLYSNTHLLRQTGAEDVEEGAVFTRELAELAGIPLKAVFCPARLLTEPALQQYPLCPVGLYLRESYLDRKV